MPNPFEFDFFISRRGPVASVAREVTDTLEAEHFKVKVQDYDSHEGQSFVEFIYDALVEAEHLIVLWTGDYDQTKWTRRELFSFLASERRVGVLRCDETSPRSLLADIHYGDLVGVTDPEARRQIILDVAHGRAPVGRRPPRIFGGTMPPANLLFTGRADQLGDMHTALLSGATPAALLQAALHGLGGIGKTSLAREYVARHGADYAGVWWITAADRPGTIAGLAALAHKLDDRLPQDIPQEDAAQFALAAIAKRPDRLLLVYDNAPAPATIAGLLPQSGAAILLTSRYPIWARQAVEIKVASLPEAEAIAFLLAATKRPDEAGARTLNAVLDGLPLALDHAATYCLLHATSFTSYADRVARLIEHDSPNADYPQSVAATVRLALEKANEASRFAEPILARLAWYAPDRIPLLLLDDALGREEDREAGRAALASVALIANDPDPTPGPSVTLHRLVQAVMRTRLGDGGPLVRDAALAQLEAMFPYAYRDAQHWPLCRQLLPHQRAITDWFADTDDNQILPALLNLSGNFLQGSGDANAALPLYQRALATSERVLGAEHPDTLTSLNNLASCLRALGDAKAALPLYQRALATRERVLGAEHPDTLISLNNLASCLRALGDAKAARPLFQRALATRERVLGAEHPDTLGSLSNMAGFLYEQDDPHAALPLAERAVAGALRVLGPEHPNTKIMVRWRDDIQAATTKPD